LNRQGKAVAALNMAVNAARHDKDYLLKVMVPAVVQCADRISSAMGYFKDENSADITDASGKPGENRGT
jgi:transcriptional regulator of nitric oxide reductase